MREAFHAEIDELTDRLVQTAAVCDDMLEAALECLATPGSPGSREIVARDNEIDVAYDEIQRAVLRLFALQAPVATDLRRLAAMLHVNIHVERLGDYAAHVAKMAGLVADFADYPELARTLVEMGARARDVSRTALRAFADRDEALARQLPQLDDHVDEHNRDVFRRLVALAGGDEARIEWATHMIVVARAIERYGDHAVDIGEQTIFVVSGETVELSSNDPEVATWVYPRFG